jgi:hypothetical protein
MRWKSYIGAIAAILGLRFLDLYVTYRYTPDLKVEWNPLISLFGVSWPGLIFTQIAIVAFISVLMFFYFNRAPATIAQTGLSFSDFIYVYFFGKRRPWPARIFTMPTNIRRHLVFNGFLFMVITALISGFAIAHNALLIARAGFYIRFVAKYYSIYFPACFIAATIFSLNLFFVIEFVNYRRAQKAGAPCRGVI